MCHKFIIILLGFITLHMRRAPSHINISGGAVQLVKTAGRLLEAELIVCGPAEVFYGNPACADGTLK